MATIYNKQLIRESGDLFLGKDFEKLFSNIRELETRVLTSGKNNRRGYLDKNIFLEEIDDKYYRVRRRTDGNKVIKELTRNEFSEDFLKTFGKRIRRFSYSVENFAESYKMTKFSEGSLSRNLNYSNFPVNLPSIPEYIYHARVDHYLDRILDIIQVKISDSKMVIPEFGKEVTNDVKYRTENLVK